MQSDRRGFVAGVLGSLCALSGRLAAQEPDRESGTPNGEEGKCLDFGLSFLCNPSPVNSVRFWIESRTILFDDREGSQNEFYQCASCKSENTFGEKDLFYQDNYDFMPIFGGEDLLVFRRHARMTDRYRQIAKAEEFWGKPILKLRWGKSVRELTTWEEMRDATAAGTPLVSQTEISNEQTGLRAVVECPIKTMNISLNKKMYQVDTGPIALPDLSQRRDPPIESLRLAFVAFNTPQFADFVIEQPTPVVQDGKEICKIYHYSDPISLPAKNRIFAVGE